MLFRSTEQSDIEDSFAIPPLTFTNWEVLSLQIPNSTPMLSKGLVQDGIITYQVTVRVRILNSGASYGNKSVSWTTSASSSNVRIKSSDSTTNSAGYTSATFHVRGMEKFPVSVKCAGKIQLIREYGQLESEEYTQDGISVKGYVPAWVGGKL